MREVCNKIIIEIISVSAWMGGSYVDDDADDTRGVVVDDDDNNNGFADIIILTASAIGVTGARARDARLYGGLCG